VEPYVVTADLYSEPPHVGRGGWSWYTGSAAWMYRLVIESLLGLERLPAALKFAPLLPDTWRGFSLAYRYRNTLYRITLRRTAGPAVQAILIDSQAIDGDTIALVDDGREHHVEVSVAGAIGMDRPEPAMFADR
jgi:cellobiose phosphorylase